MYNQQIISDTVYNSTQKITLDENNFMMELEIIKFIKIMKLKNCEGHDRTRLRILFDGIQTLRAP